MASSVSTEMDTTAAAATESTVTTVVTETIVVDADRAQMQAMINEVRTKFLQEYEANPDLYDPTDIELVKCDDWQVERFILRKKTVDSSVEMLKNTLQWRHELMMPQRKDTDFPEEFYKIGGMFGFESDVDGNGVVYMRVRLHKKVKELEKYVKQYMMHIINKLDRQVNGKGITVVFDCSGAGLTNLDMDIIWFLVDSLIKYYPYGLKHILVYEMPWILSSAWVIIKNWMPDEFRDAVKFVSKKNIVDYIPRKNLPYYLGGQNKTNYHQVPKGCRPAEELAIETGLSKKDIQKVIKAFEPFMEEAEQESNFLDTLQNV